MFTGIIEDLGKISSIKKGTDLFKLEIISRKITSDLSIGGSVAVNGVCLTAVKKQETKFIVDVMPQTVKKTNINDLKVGSKVNLERAMPANGRFEGHIVQGHVDGVGSIIKTKKEGNATVFNIKTTKEVAGLMVNKGSVTMDGISLTLIDPRVDSFSVSIIPHTAKLTTLGFKKVGDKVNLEVDILGKYIAKFLNQKGENKLSKDFLMNKGFM